MTRARLLKLVESQLRTEIHLTWGIDMDQYACQFEGDPQEALNATFTRALNKSHIQVDNIFVSDDGTLMQWSSPVMC